MFDDEEIGRCVRTEDRRRRRWRRRTRRGDAATTDDVTARQSHGPFAVAKVRPARVTLVPRTTPASATTLPTKLTPLSVAWLVTCQNTLHGSTPAPRITCVVDHARDHGRNAAGGAGLQKGADGELDERRGPLALASWPEDPFASVRAAGASPFLLPSTTSRARAL